MRFASLFSELAAVPAAPLSPRERLEARGLTRGQVDAVLCNATGEVLVAATAGSGKTTTLTERVVHLLGQGVSPQDLVVCTFTRNAADELRNRVRARLPGLKALPYCGTLHSLALSLLGGSAALGREGVRLLSEAELDGLVATAGDLQPPSHAELTAHEFVALLQRHEEQGSRPSALLPSMLAWEERLKSAAAWDFVLLLKEAVRRKPARRFRHVLVDEAQDLTALQFAWLDHIQAAGACRFLVGDDDQAIYCFRGAGHGVLAARARDAAAVFTLERNQRCARSIVAHAARLIAHDRNRFPLAPVAARSDEGQVEVRQFACLADEVAAAQAAAAAPGFCVLGRTHAVLQPFRDAGLPTATIHEAKGREWPHAWLTGCESGRLPHPLGPLDEERRLVYVACTRAREHLTLGWTDRRSNKAGLPAATPSRFLSEMQAGPPG